MPSKRQLVRRPLRAFLVLLAAAGLLAAALAVPGGAQAGSGATAASVGLDYATDPNLDDVDNRAGNVAPSAAAKARVRALGARVEWTHFGTAASLIKQGGYLAGGLSQNPVTAARSFISTNKALFRLTDAAVGNLELVNDSRLTESQGHAVLFRQRFGSLSAAQDGMITVGVVGGKVAYASSSATGAAAAPATSGLIGEQAAWLAAAANVGHQAVAADISGVRQQRGWTVFDAAGLDSVQQVRLVALPTPTDGVKAAYETIVYDSTGGDEFAYTVFVDAQSGAVLVRTNRLSHAAAPEAAGTAAAALPMAPTAGGFTGSYTPPACGTRHDIEVPAGTQSIYVAAQTTPLPEDIILNLYDPNNDQVASSDQPLGPNPEAIAYSPGGDILAGTYEAEVCPFEADQSPASYEGAYATSEQSADAFPFPPMWKYFLANPPLSGSNDDTRIIGCFSRADGQTANQPPPPGCDREEGNTAARQPWDTEGRTSTPTFTTRGNAARAAEAWLSPLTPAEQYSPISPERTYVYPWEDMWRDSTNPLDPGNGCSPTVFGTPGMEDPSSGRNDIDAATTSLFVNHNRMHDWSYFLGFTENNFNLQFSNFGNTPPDQENDPEVGNAQAGAVDGGFPSFMGRDNANQITLNDGIPGITNMYLWQPLPGAFYADCVDGDFDQSVIAHEYTHAISNRMVGGPDAGLTSSNDGQARAMGESYSDLTAVEYLNEYDYVPTNNENPFAVGPYVTGNKEAGIRNYGMNVSPLNFSDVQGYDGSGVNSPHDDGEIWSAVNYQIRQALIARYNGGFPAGSNSLQKRCADGVLPADECPGNRRWMQMVFDAYLLMPPDVSMLGSRDAYLAADLMRYGGAAPGPDNQTLLWGEFAERGFGQFASTADTNDPQPVPSFESPRQGNEATITWRFIDDDGDQVDNANVYAGDYEGRVSPIADTDPSTPLDDVTKFVPGTYDFVVQADGLGLTRLTRDFSPNEVRRTQYLLLTNHASESNGATITGDGVNLEGLIDDTEATNFVSGPPGSDFAGTVGNDADQVDGRQVTVDLAGGRQKIDVVKVSALLRSGAMCAGDENCDPQDLSQNRFSALRQFVIEVCTAAPGNQQCANRSTVSGPGDGYERIFDSPANAFPGGTPRPLAPQLIFREFDVPDRQATHVRMVVLDNQCTGNNAYHGDQDADPLVNSDCRRQGALFPFDPEFAPDELILAPQDENVRAAELQVFSAGGEGGGGGGTVEDPFVTFTKTGPLTADQGQRVTYSLDYSNLGPAPSSQVKIIDKLPAGVSYVSGTGPDNYNSTTRTVTWNIGTVPVLADGSVQLTVRVAPGVETGSVLTNTARFTAPLTVATPAVAATLVL